MTVPAAAATPSKAEARRAALRAGLVAAAERRIAADGLGGLRARDLAAEAGCALGAIYTVFPDLDALILEVNLRTLGLFEAALGPEPAGFAAEPPPTNSSASGAPTSLSRKTTAGVGAPCSSTSPPTDGARRIGTSPSRPASSAASRRLCRRCARTSRHPIAGCSPAACSRRRTASSRSASTRA